MTRPLEAEPAVFGPNANSTEPDRQKDQERNAEDLFERVSESRDFSVFHSENNLVALLGGGKDKNDSSQDDSEKAGDRESEKQSDKASDKASGKEPDQAIIKKLDASKPLFGGDDLIFDLGDLSVNPGQFEKLAELTKPAVEEKQKPAIAEKPVVAEAEKPAVAEAEKPVGAEVEKPAVAEQQAEVETDLNKQLKPQEPSRHETSDGTGNAWVRVEEPSGQSWHLQDTEGGEITDKLPGMVETASDDTSIKHRIEAVEPQSDKSIKLSLEDGSVLRSRPDGSVLRYADEAAFSAGRPSDVYKPNGDHNSYVFEGDEIKEAHLSKDFYKVSDNIWATSPTARSGWHGKLELDGRTGDLRVTALSGTESGVTNLYKAGGRHEILRPDGTAEFSFKVDGDPAERTFKFDQSFGSGGASGDSDSASVLTQPLSMKVKGEDGKISTWTRIGGDGDRYVCDGEGKRARIEVSRDEHDHLSYRFENLDTGYKKEVSNGILRETRVEGDTTEVTENGKTLEISIGASRMFMDKSVDKVEDTAGDSGNGEAFVRIEQPSLNRLWTKDLHGDWKDEALSTELPYESPGELSRLISENSNLDDRQKLRMLENVDAMSMEGHSPEELERFYQETTRLLTEPEGKKSFFNAAERADLVEQLLFHAVNEEDNNQGVNPSCSMTGLRGLLLYDKPSVVAGLVADIADSGSFKTTDGSVITPPPESLKIRSGSPEAQFPPKGSSRSWLSQIWDVTAYNVHYQRQTTDRHTGMALKNERMEYELRQAADGDSGCRLVKTGPNGERTVLAKNYTDNTLEQYHDIGMYLDQCLDVYHQITGETLKGRAFTGANSYVGDKSVFNALGGERWSDLSSLERDLTRIEKADQWPVYISLQSSVLKQRRDQQKSLDKGESPNSVPLGTGGYHILLINDFDPVSKTIQVDNSWGDAYDIETREELLAAGIDPATRITFSTQDLFNAMQRSANAPSKKNFKGWYWMKDR
ncbi:MAG: hypothetical protein KC652_13085 [Cyanobacteria bacterium HKST-UBA01]|nr:hypothetical protein [Cyanobacteria bacterium HKST-UBA01]